MKKIAVELNGVEGLVTHLKLDVIDYFAYEPAAYVTDPGWLCEDPLGMTEYFINESGIVFSMPENDEVGVAPELKKASERIERELEDLWDRAERELPTQHEHLEEFDPQNPDYSRDNDPED